MSQSYEDKFCKNSGQLGVAVLGDSVSAHFHLPEQWFGNKLTVKLIQNYF
jgi:hypothetical protein